MANIFHNVYYALLTCCLIGAFALLPTLLLPVPLALGQTRAQQIAGQLEIVRRDEAKAQPLVARMNELAAANEAMKKEYQTAQAQMTGLQPRIQHYNADLARYETELRGYDQRLKDYNGRCSGTLPDEKFKSCLKDKGDLAAARIELDQRRDRLEDLKRPLEAEMRGISKGQSDLARNMAKNVEGWDAAQRDYRALFQAIEVSKRALAELCAAGDAARDPQAVRQCVSLGWDAAKKDFSALVDLPPPLAPAR